jgi:hypothetical protein
VDEAYWRGLVRWEMLAETGMVAAADLTLLHFAADAETAWEAIAAALMLDMPR